MSGAMWLNISLWRQKLNRYAAGSCPRYGRCKWIQKLFYFGAPPSDE